MAVERSAEELHVVYLARIKEARGIAAATQSPIHKKVWDDIADDWQRKAENLVSELKP
jgi:hypothetical protein